MKLDKVFFHGYLQTTKAYWVFDKVTSRVEEYIHAKFLKTSSTLQEEFTQVEDILPKFEELNINNEDKE